jgi:DNA-binding XRE family transcriptional regulator
MTLAGFPDASRAHGGPLVHVDDHALARLAIHPIVPRPHVEAFPARLRALRVARQWTLDDCAVRAGIGVTTWDAWERGKALPKFEYLLRIAHALGLTLDDVMRAPVE